ncbi:hypothetical protein A8B82_14725 [Sulfitobacter sp. EhC04]|uniref:type VI secretion system protein TssA n=1 Tax=Sulfitobacter sp. EhC04 TaxID=1849168 RepID=UPI0007F3948E|nr:type VI secretion system protein TssA [Sulfitobacter sp. EhC04]OAN76962.1 hypothetical protein A8B82_14725 [Sulfitobacter sp. EhC04]
MDITRLLEPLGEDTPSGIELRNEAGFHSLERLIEPAARENRLNSDGSINEAAPDVDWDAVFDDALALAAKGRDLRLLCVVVRALFAEQGFAGLKDGIGLLTDTLDQYWDSLHPELRERDDPVAAALPRTNALRQLDNDDNGLLGDIKFSVVLNPRGIGPILGDDLAKAALSDFEVLNRAASGLGQAEKDALVARHGQRVNRVKAAGRQLAAEEPERAEELITALRKCQEGLAALIAKLAEKGGFGDAPGLALPELTELLEKARETLEKARADTDKAADTVEDAPADVISTGASAAQTGKEYMTGADGGSGDINSRTDVERALDRIVAFYERTEPSSPIPHLARRMRRMVAMDFLQLMEEIAPSGLKEFRGIAGVEEERKK